MNRILGRKKKASGHDSRHDRTKAAVAALVAYPEFTYDPQSSSSDYSVSTKDDDDNVEETFGSFDRLYLEVDDSSSSFRSQPSSSVLFHGRLGGRNDDDAAAAAAVVPPFHPTATGNAATTAAATTTTKTTVLADLELPTTPTTITSWFSTSPRTSTTTQPRSNHAGTTTTTSTNLLGGMSVSTLRIKNSNKNKIRYPKHTSINDDSADDTDHHRHAAGTPTTTTTPAGRGPWCGTKWSAWDIMIVTLCVVILGGCVLLLFTVLHVQDMNNKNNPAGCHSNNNADDDNDPSSASNLRGTTAPSYDDNPVNMRNDTVTDLATQGRRAILRDWLFGFGNDNNDDDDLLLTAAFHNSPQRLALDWLSGVGSGDLDSIFGPDLPSKREYDQYQQQDQLSTNNNNRTVLDQIIAKKEEEVQQQQHYLQLQNFRDRLMQRYALLVLYFSLGGTYPILGWATPSGARLHECDWPNVSCEDKDENDNNYNNDTNNNDNEPSSLYVTQLQLDIRMAGSIPSEIGLLSHLETLRIEGAEITGAVPSEIYSFTNLYSLAVTNTPTMLSKIPAKIGTNFPNLVSLDLRHGGFVGSVPTELGLLTKLRYLLLDTNDLVGSIPTELGALTMLDKATFHDTWVSGQMPPAVCQLHDSAMLQNLTANCYVHSDDETTAEAEGPLASASGIRFLSHLRVSCDCCALCV